MAMAVIHPLKLTAWLVLGPCLRQLQQSKARINQTRRPLRLPAFCLHFVELGLGDESLPLPRDSLVGDFGQFMGAAPGALALATTPCRAAGRPHGPHGGF